MRDIGTTVVEVDDLIDAALAGTIDDGEVLEDVALEREAGVLFMMPCPCQRHEAEPPESGTAGGASAAVFLIPSAACRPTCRGGDPERE